MVAPGRDFVVAPFIGQIIGEDQKKKCLRCKTSWFSVRKYVMTRKKKKGLCQPISGFSVSKEKKTKWCHPGMPKPGGYGGDISPQLFGCIPPIV